MHLSVAQWLPIFATLLLQLAVLVIMVRRKFRLVFPLFFNFIAFSMLSISIRVILFSHLSRTQCRYLGWTFMALATMLAFGVMRELFINILAPYAALVDMGKLLFRWALVFLALVSFVTALAANDTETNRILAALDVLTSSSQLMQCGLLLLFIVFQSRLGLSWRTPAICIMLGFGCNASVVLCSSFIRDHFPAWSPALAWVAPICCVAVYSGWLLGLVLPQPARRTVQDSPTRLILQRWNEALMASPLVSMKGEIAAMSPVESFLPGVERTVERVMARKMMH